MNIIIGSLSERIIAKYNLRENSDPQSYGIGLKEVLINKKRGK